MLTGFFDGLCHISTRPATSRRSPDTQRVIERAGGAVAIKDQIEQTVATMTMLPENVGLITGDHPAFRALEESAKLVSGQHPAFEILQASAKLFEVSGIESTLANYGALTKDIAHPLITSTGQTRTALGSSGRLALSAWMRERHGGAEAAPRRAPA